MPFTKERQRHVVVATIFCHLAALLLFGGDATVHRCRRGSEPLQRTVNGRVLLEGQVGSLADELHNYSKTNLSIPSFVQVKLKDSYDRKIRRGGATPEGNYHIPNCDDTDGSANFLKKMYRSIKAFLRITSHEKSWCLKYERFRRVRRDFVYVVQSSLSVGRTRVCLIDTGVDLKDEVVGHFVRMSRGGLNQGGDNPGEQNERRADGINTQRCNEKNYASCQSSDVHDEDMHGTFIANTVIRRDLLMKGGAYKRGVDLIVCNAFAKSFGNAVKNSHLVPLIKCLEMCKERGAKVIHVGYNVQGESEQLVKLMEELQREEIVVVSPSLQVYHRNGGETNSKKEHLEEPSTQKMYPASFADTFENVFSVGALRNSPQGGLVPILGNSNPRGEKPKGEQLHKRENTTLFSFSYGKTFPFGRSPPSMVEDAQAYASADFVNALVMIFNVNPKLSMKRVRLILERSIGRRSELKGLSKWGGYLDPFKLIAETLKERNELCGRFFRELGGNLEEGGGGLLGGGLPRGEATEHLGDWVERPPNDEDQRSCGEATTGEATPRLDAAFPPQGGELEEIERQFEEEAVRGLDHHNLGYYHTDAISKWAEDFPDGGAAPSEGPPSDTTYRSSYNDEEDVYTPDEANQSFYGNSGGVALEVVGEGGLSSLPLGVSFLDKHTSDGGSAVPPLPRRNGRGRGYESGEGTSPPMNRRSLGESGLPERWDQTEGTHVMNEEDRGDGYDGQADWITQMRGTNYVDGHAYKAARVYGNSPEGIPEGELSRPDWGWPTTPLSRWDPRGETPPWGDDHEGYGFSPQLDDDWGGEYGRKGRRRDELGRRLRRDELGRKRTRDELRRRRRRSPRAVPRQRRRTPTRGRTAKRLTGREAGLVRKNGPTGKSRNGNAMRFRSSGRSVRGRSQRRRPVGGRPVLRKPLLRKPLLRKPLLRKPVRAFAPKTSRVVMGRR
ncbi:conserved Plasmodium protein, unknown function [Plasmodium vivax]|uniref:subtilisin n=1 Tax=Plasmodium vivax TaxID=5855 RepID=A0A1G4HEC5_PLAVI|nr:conserved Plasmodium protein, unknown function [Plasmodium vivax]